MHVFNSVSSEIQLFPNLSLSISWSQRIKTWVGLLCLSRITISFYIETQDGEGIATGLRTRALPPLVHCLMLWNMTTLPKCDNTPELAVVTNAAFKILVKLH